MGSDDHFKKNRAKSKKELKRKKPTREENKRVLIVCEGEKTEPNYFEELIIHYRINTADVKVDGSCDSAPSRVFKHAKYLQGLATEKGDPFDEVYCVFDRDSHPCYFETVSNINAFKKSGKFIACTSIPCFEIWLILHYKYLNKPYTRTERKSIGDLAEKDLIIFFPAYKKGMKGTFFHHQCMIETAISNSKKLINDNKKADTDNPSTYIHNLVEKLIKMGRK